MERKECRMGTWDGKASGKGAAAAMLKISPLSSLHAAPETDAFCEERGEHSAGSIQSLGNRESIPSGNFSPGNHQIEPTLLRIGSDSHALGRKEEALSAPARCEIRRLPSTNESVSNCLAPRKGKIERAKGFQSECKFLKKSFHSMSEHNAIENYPPRP